MMIDDPVRVFDKDDDCAPAGSTGATLMPFSPAPTGSTPGPTAAGGVDCDGNPVNVLGAGVAQTVPHPSAVQLTRLCPVPGVALQGFEIVAAGASIDISSLLANAGATLKQCYSWTAKQIAGDSLIKADYGQCALDAGEIWSVSASDLPGSSLSTNVTFICNSGEMRIFFLYA